jgi:hypothetical protein
MTKIYLTIAESLGTDNEFSTEVFVSMTKQEAGEMASSLISDMIKTMYDGEQEIDPTRHWELEGEGWFYRVRVEEAKIPVEVKRNPKRFASNISWDTDTESETIFDVLYDLPSSVEIPECVDDNDIADYLSDVYGFTVMSFVINYN